MVIELGHKVGTEKINTLISAAYALTLDPGKYDEIIDIFDDIIFANHNTKTSSGIVQLADIDQNMDQHFEQAHKISQQIGRVKTKVSQETLMVEQAPSAAIVFDENEGIIAMNKLASKFQDSICATLSDYCTDKNSLENIRTFIGKADSTGILAEPGRLRHEDTVDTCIIVRKISPASEPTGPTSNKTVKFFLFSIDLSLSPEKISFFKQVFSLTDAEADVANRLAGGHKPQKIAEDRGSTLNTVRSQIKSIKNKTQTHSSSDIIRLIYGLTTGLSVSSQNENQINADDFNPQHYKRRKSLVLSDGREMSYFEQGAENGYPVLFIHGMLYGSALSESAAHVAKTYGIRIIAPMRPGFGRSDLAPDKYGDELLDTVARDMCQLLDHLKIKKSIIVGLVLGAVYALRFATLFPNRTDDLFSISYAPIWRETWLQDVPKRQRFIARLAKHAPKLLKLITLSGVSLIDKGKGGQFIEGLHKDIPADAKALSNPGVLKIVCSGLEESVTQGAEAFRRDCPFPTIDFSQEASSLTMPLHIIHGDGDQVTKPAKIKEFKRYVPHTKVEVVPDAGQLLFFSHWEHILKALRKSAKMAKSAK